METIAVPTQIPSTNPQPPLIVITGPTASGKSGLAMELAERFSGEIICADSRTIYKGMDIGTAKPTHDERSRVLHHLLDVVEPGERYTAADFQSEALSRIEMIRKRGNVPFMVGGTGLYIDAVVREYEWPEWTRNESDRKGFESHTTEELHTMIEMQHLSLPSNLRNRRHLINTLMRDGSEGKARLLPRENVFVVAIATEKNELEKRIRSRAYTMFENGVLEEAEHLADQYGWDSEAMSSNIYPIIRRVINNEITVERAVDLFVIKDKQLAKRQVTWLKRHDYVQWMSLDEAREYIGKLLTLNNFR